MRKLRAKNPSTQKIFHIISVAGGFMFLYGLFYVIQDLALGRISFLNSSVVQFIPLKVPVFSLISVLIVLKFFKISSPYKQRKA